jgi:polysaccharide biosynthesis/export protein
MQTRSMKCRLGWLAIACILGVGLSSSNAQAQDPKLDHKLVQYIKDAKKSGQDEAQVQQKAIKAGWPAAAVTQALAYVYGKPSATPMAVAAGGPQAQPEASSGPAVGHDVPSESSTSVALNGSNGKAAASATPGSTSTGSKTRAGNATSGTAFPVPYEYRIGAGDILQVSVWKEPDASAPNVVVRPDGMISTPLIKEIQVAGLTPKQAEILITERLVKVIQEPDVTVIVTGMSSKKIYAIGAVKKEGPIAYTYSMTIMQAIAEAGGLTDYAKRNKIYVLRTENGKESKFPFFYDDILKGKHMEQNIVMLPFDTLVVPH